MATHYTARRPRRCDRRYGDKQPSSMAAFEMATWRAGVFPRSLDSDCQPTELGCQFNLNYLCIADRNLSHRQAIADRESFECITID